MKLQFFLHAGDTEIGGFGISSEDDLLYIQDFVTIKQRTSSVTVEFDDEAVADYFDARVDEGMVPSHFARIWMHTHPGSCPNPSSVDEMTFERVFGACDWALMFIIARSGQTYARLRFSAGPQAVMLLPVAVDWAAWASAVMDEDGELLSQFAENWMNEFGENIYPEMFELPLSPQDPSPDKSHRRSRLSLLSDLPLHQADEGWWELDPEMAALAQMEDELRGESSFRESTFDHRRYFS